MTKSGTQTPSRRFTRSLLRQWSATWRGLVSPGYLALVLAGGVAYALPRPAAALPLGMLLLKACAEEAAFRFGLQETVHRLISDRTFGPVSVANLAASATFSAMHLVSHSPPWALATFVPSLAFGLVWDRHRSLPLCVLLHFVYNALYFHRPLLGAG